MTDWAIGHLFKPSCQHFLIIISPFLLVRYQLTERVQKGEKISMVILSGAKTGVKFKETHLGQNSKPSSEG